MPASADRSAWSFLEPHVFGAQRGTGSDAVRQVQPGWRQVRSLSLRRRPGVSLLSRNLLRLSIYSAAFTAVPYAF